MHTTRTIVASAIACALTAGSSADIVFVRANQLLPTGLQTGSSWAFAFKDLQAALAAAQSGDQIWIAEGVYRPTAGTNVLATFSMKPNVHLIGGFAGVESEIVERDILNHRTILSGEIGAPGPSDNSIHVVSASNISAGSLVHLNGLQIEGGNATGTPQLGFSSGAAVNVFDAAIQLNSCIITRNSATNAVISSSSSLSDRSLRMMNCLVVHNDGTAIAAGGPAFNSLAHSTIAFNTKGISLSGSGIGDSRLLAMVVSFNGGGSEAEQVSFNGPLGSVTVGTSIIQGWDGVAPSGSTNVSIDPEFRDVDGADNVAATPDDRFDLLGSSPGIDRGVPTGVLAVGFSDSLDVDSDGDIGERYPFDITGAPRLVDDPIQPFEGDRGDSGAFEYQRKRVVFVDADATGLNEGTSWQHAFTDLQDAIATLADPVNGGSGEIWVAEGTYRPTSGSDSTISFEPGPGVELYGGFAGGESDRSLRDWRAHRTILSGDLLPSQAANSQHVVRFNGLSASGGILDGFVIRDGHAIGVGGAGGGISITNDASPVIRNCVITANTSGATANGAGVAMSGSGAGGPIIVQCAIVGNGSPTSGPGAGVLLANPKAIIAHSIIAGNRSASGAVGAGVHATATSANHTAISNSLLFDNIAGGGQGVSAQIRNASGGAPISLSTSAIEGFGSGAPGTSSFNCLAYVDGDVQDADGADNQYGTADDDLAPRLCSPLVDVGDATQIPLDLGDLDHDSDEFDPLPIDFLGRPRRLDMPVADAAIGGGIALDIGLIELSAVDLPTPDLTGNGVVDAADLALLLGAWNQADSPLDLDGDCVIGGGDLAILLGQWS